MAAMKDKHMGHLIEYYTCISLGISYTVSVLGNILQREKQRLFLKRIAEIDCLFEKISNVDSDSEQHRRTHVIGFVVLYTIHGLLQLFDFSTLIYNQIFSLLDYWIFITFLSNCVTIRQIEAFTVASALKAKFDKLNECIRNIQRTNADYARNSLQKIGYKQMHFSRLSFSKLACLRHIYRELWELTKNFNERFGLILLLNICFDFASTIANLYVILKASKGSLMSGFTIYACIRYILIRYFSIILVTRACHFCSKSAKQTSALVHRMPVENGNEEQVTLIKKFSLQLMHQKVTFHACNFFDIDMSLLYTLSGATTTYYVILVQFYMYAQRE